MKALFNCNVIKNVYLRDNDNIWVELEITYLDNSDKTWVSRKKIDELSQTNREYQIERYTKAFEKLKQALLNNDKYVEIEI